MNSLLTKYLFSEHVYILGYRWLDGANLIDVASNFHEEKDDKIRYLYKCKECTSRYWNADPMLYNICGKTYLFTEMYDRYQNKGCIGVSEFIDNEYLGEPRKCLEEAFHLSFPFLFEVNGKIYMCPECVSARQVRIYKMGSDVTEWKLYREVDVTNIVDTVVHISDGIMYFVSSEENEDDYQKNRNKLRIFVCETELFERSNEAFKQNFRDITEQVYGKKEWSYQIRNAGALVVRNEELYRIVQNSDNVSYGIAFCIYQINELNINIYDEKFLELFSVNDFCFENLPANYTVERTHTYAISGGIEVVDLYVEIRGGKVLLSKICRVINNLIRGVKRKK